MKKNSNLLVAIVRGSVSGALSHLNANQIYVDTMAEAKAALKLADAFILTGGGDVSPKRYGQAPIKQCWGISHERDELEFYIVEQCRQKNIPIMGICRGNQLLNVAFGGTLHQDIDTWEEERHWGYTLSVQLNRKSGLYRHIRNQWMRTSHYHHQAIDRIGDGLMPAAWSVDGFIEAIESWPGMQPFVLGTQFHPEMDWMSDDDNEDVFRYFLSRVTSRKRLSAIERRDRFEDKFPPYTTTYTKSNNVTTLANRYTVPREATTADERIAEDWELMWKANSSAWDSAEDIIERSIREREKEAIATTTRYLDECDTYCTFPPCRDPWACNPKDGDCLAASVALAFDGESRSIRRSEAKRGHFEGTD